MSSRTRQYPDCVDDCPAADEAVDMLDAELVEERDCWARAAEILAEANMPLEVWTMGYVWPSGAGVYLRPNEIALAYAIAEAYGDNWREILEGKEDMA